MVGYVSRQNKLQVGLSSRRLTVNVGFATEEGDASAAGSSARTTAAASAAVAPIEKRIVIAYCRRRAEVLSGELRG